MEMDTTVAWPVDVQSQRPSWSRKEEANACAPVTDCYFRSDNTSQGTNMSSLAGSTATRYNSVEGRKEDLVNENRYGQEDMDQFAEDLENTQTFLISQRRKRSEQEQH